MISATFEKVAGVLVAGLAWCAMRRAGDQRCRGASALPWSRLWTSITC
jgi:hypothetical protein